MTKQQLNKAKKLDEIIKECTKNIQQLEHMQVLTDSNSSFTFQLLSNTLSTTSIHTKATTLGLKTLTFLLESYKEMLTQLKKELKEL